MEVRGRGWRGGCAWSLASPLPVSTPRMVVHPTLPVLSRRHAKPDGQVPHTLVPRGAPSFACPNPNATGDPLLAHGATPIVRRAPGFDPTRAHLLEEDLVVGLLLHLALGPLLLASKTATGGEAGGR